VGVDRGAPRGGVRAIVKQRAQLRTLWCPLVAGLVEDLRDGAPARPPREHLLLVAGGGAIVALQAAQQVERGEVGLHA